MVNRATLVIAAVLLFFFVSTSSQFANISSVQEELRQAQLKLQLKLIQQKIEFLQGEVFKVGKEEQKTEETAESSGPSKEELKAGLENQIKALETVVAALKPRAVVEEAARIEKRIQEINQEVKKATDKEELTRLQVELEGLVNEYADLQSDIQKSLVEELKRQQALLLEAKIRELQGKIQLLPSEPVTVKAAESIASKADQKSLDLVREEIEKVQLKLLQTKAKIIQEQIKNLSK